MDPEAIVIKGAREHNLQDVSLTLPRGRLICFTGVSGSGKSSFAFDTLHAEGQRRYIESLSSYARQFLGQLPKPDVDLITGLSPTISIQQKSTGWNPRSTVGTVTQILDFLRVLFARIGTAHCTKCGLPISAQTREQIVGQIMALPEGSKLAILGSVARQQKGEYRDLFEDMLRRGFARARVNGKIVSLSEDPHLDRNSRHDIDIVVDRVVLKAGIRTRIAQAVETALELGDGTLVVQRGDDEAPSRNRPGGDLLLSSRYACAPCGISFEPPSPQLFSFNSPTGMCLTCDGLGSTYDFDPKRLVPDPSKSFLDVAIEPMRIKTIGKWRRHIYEAVAKELGISLATPWKDLPPRARQALLNGTGDKHLTYEWKWAGGVWRHGGMFPGVIQELRDVYRKVKAGFLREYYEKYMHTAPCADCSGARLNRKALAVRFNDRTIHDVSTLTISAAAEFFANLTLTKTQQLIAEEALKEIRARLQFLQDVGLEYLSLHRSAPSLSGGEAQRIRLASQIGSGLTGVLYILDEPSIGLHPRDNRRLLDSLLRLRDLGNTVIVVEHDEETMRTADLLVDFGPGPGVRGGHVVAEGTLRDLMHTEQSLTGQYLSGKAKIDVPATRRPVGRPPDSPAEPDPAESSRAAKPTASERGGGSRGKRGRSTKLKQAG